VPTYQYRCTECGERHEAVQSFTDPALTECPKCGGTLRKVFSSVGVVFKGSGFYRTDSRDKPDSADRGADRKVDATTDGKAGTKSGTKSEGTSETKSDTKTDSGSSSSTSSPTKSSDSSSAA
jgi:putative FmdB family regulatory protein